MARIIITADDYGISEGVNEAVLSGINLGVITSTNVMVNMPFCDKKILDYKDKVSIGIHWNLTAGKCVSNPNLIRTLVKQDGSFYSFSVFKKRVKQGLINKKHIIIELKAQFDLFVLKYGFIPVYWNTHQNIVLLPKLTSIFFKLGKKLGIGFTRTFNRKYIDYFSLSPKKRIREFFVKKYVWYIFDFRFSRFSQKTKYREIVFDRKNKNNMALIKKMLSSCKHHDSVEIVYHPSTKLDCTFFGTIGNERIEEYHFIVEQFEELFAAFKQNNIELVSYSNLF